MDVGENTVRGIDVVFQDVFLNLVEIGERIRMEGSGSSTRPSALALFAQLPERLLAIDRFHPTALEIVVAAVERRAD